MDRHDVPGVTAKDVARVHQKDLELQDQFGCRALTYWFDSERGTAFCLIEAPNVQVVENLHQQAHGMIPTRVIPVDSQVVESFLGRIEDPKTTPDASGLPIVDDPAFRTILVAELRDAAVIKARVGSREALQRFAAHRKDVERALNRFEGRKTRQTETGLLASFASASKAVHCALELQGNWREDSKQLAVPGVYVAIGLSAGEPLTEGKDLFREVMRLGQRLAYVAGREEILVSSALREPYQRESLELLSDEERIRLLDPSEEDFLNRMMDVVQRRWNQEALHVDDLAREIGLSKAQLYRKTVSLTGHSPTAFVREFRLRTAVRWLEQGKGNISTIAYETGFGNPSYFSKCFEKRFDVLPSELAATLA